MTAIERVRRTQRLLGAGAAIHALAWGLTATLGLLSAVSFAALLAPGIANDAGWQIRLAIAMGSAVASVILWQARHVASRSRVALWIEEMVPGLHYSLVTALENHTSVFAAGMERTVDRHEIGRMAGIAVRKRLIPAVAAALSTALLLYISSSAAFGGGSFLPRLAVVGSSAGVPAGSRLENLEVRITPPAYTRESAITLDDPSSVPAIVGSRLVVRGQGTSSGVAASVGGVVIGVGSPGNGWTVSLLMPPRPAALTLRDRGYDRIIVLDPRADNPPRIVLTAPSRDTTLREARMQIRLAAGATDDIGLNGGYFEYLVTTGSGEVFSARTITTPVVRFGGARSGSIAATLDLGSLKLNQGDVISIRAIAEDVNVLSGPGLTTSDTRTFRIARADEYDSVAVDPAGPLPVDSSAMSQRMLIMMTEQLVRDQKKVTRKELVRRSGEIGDLEDRVRRRVHEILFEIEGDGAEEEDASAPPDMSATLEGEESDNVYRVQNPDLFEAYNALWAAVRSLQIAEPGPALPPMRVALRALDRARLANRLYLRGIPPRMIVDISRVRMTGKEKGFANLRTPRSPADTARAQLERRFSAALELIPREGASAIRELTLLQVEALSTVPSFATAIGEAVDAFRKGRDATLPLLRARRALSGDPSGTSGLSTWSGGW